MLKQYKVYGHNIWSPNFQWQNVVHWRREWQTTSVFLPWEPHEQYEKAKWYDTERGTSQVGRCFIAVLWLRASLSPGHTAPVHLEPLALSLSPSRDEQRGPGCFQGLGTQLLREEGSSRLPWGWWLCPKWWCSECLCRIWTSERACWNWQLACAWVMN